MTKGKEEILAHLYNWYKYFEEEGKKYGYPVNGPKCWLIMQTQDLAWKAEPIFAEEVTKTTERKFRLGSAIGLKEYKDQYCREKVQGWIRDISSLAKIAKSQPHAVTKAYKSKFTYFMRTIEAFEDYVDPVHETLNEILLPQIFGQEEPLADELCELVTLIPA